MDVCLVTSYYPPYVGGIETYTKNLGEALARRGHYVSVYCSSRGSEPGASHEGRVRVVRFRTPAILYGAPIGLFPPSFLRDHFDVIHCNFPNPYFAATSAWVGTLRGIPSVLTWHNDLPGVTPGASVLVGIHDRVSPCYLDLFGAIIATTSVYAKQSRTLTKYSQKVRIISNGVDTRRFNPEVSGSGVREKYGLQESFVVLFVGALTRWHGYKGLDLLIEAFATASSWHPSMKLLVVGDGELAGTYKSMASARGVADKVRFAGGVEEEQIPMFYAACDVAVLPSRNSSEGFGLVLLEAMASGKPVIGSAVGGIPELIRNGGNGLLFTPNDAGELAKALTQIYRMGDERLSMGKAGREFAELRDWSGVAESVESAYENLVHPR